MNDVCTGFCDSAMDWILRKHKKMLTHTCMHARAHTHTHTHTHHGIDVYKEITSMCSEQSKCLDKQFFYDQIL